MNILIQTQLLDILTKGEVWATMKVLENHNAYSWVRTHFYKFGLQMIDVS